MPNKSKRPFSSIFKGRLSTIYEDFAASPSQSTEPFNYTTFIESCGTKGFPVLKPRPVIQKIEEKLGEPIVIETAKRGFPVRGRYERENDYILRALKYYYSIGGRAEDIFKKPKKDARTDDPDQTEQLEISDQTEQLDLSGPPEQVDLVKDLVSSPPEQLEISGPFSQLEISGPPEQFEIVPLMDFPIGNFYFSFTNPSFFMLLTLSLVLLFFYFVTKKMKKNKENGMGLGAKPKPPPQLQLQKK